MVNPVLTGNSKEVSTGKDTSVSLKKSQMQNALKIELGSTSQHTYRAANVPRRTSDVSSDRMNKLQLPETTATFDPTATLSVSEPPSPTTTLVHSPQMSLSNSRSSDKGLSYSYSLQPDISSSAKSATLKLPESLLHPKTLERQKDDDLESISSSNTDFRETASNLKVIVAPVVTSMEEDQLSIAGTVALQIMNRFMDLANILKKVIL